MTEDIKQQKKLQKRADRLKAYFRARGMPLGDLDHVDFYAVQDETLGFQEDVRRLKAAEPGIQAFFAQKIVNVRDLEQDARRKAHEEEVRFLSQREEELLRNLKESPQSVEVNSFFRGLEVVTEAFAGSGVNALVVHGGAGLGKSYNVVRTLARTLGEDKVVSIVGHATPLAFYKLLYQHRAGKVIVMDDLDVRTLRNDLFVAMLKAASWSTTGHRIVQWHSTAKALAQEDIPQSFEFESKLVVLANGVPDNDEFKAFLSRALVKEVQFSFDDLRKLFAGLATLDYKNSTLEERKEVIAKLFENVRASTSDLSLRLYVKAMELYSWNKDKWFEAFKETLSFDRDKQAYLEAVAGYSSTSERVAFFTEHTGKGRRSYFRVQSQMKSTSQ